MNATPYPRIGSVPSPVDMLLSRVSVPPRLLGEPGPTDVQLDLILDAALRAPDHGNLKPARFILVRGEARHRFGDMLAEAHLGRDPQAPPAIADKFRTWPRAAPVVIAVAAKVRTGHAIPEIEQVLSAGASAMNVLNAAHALGFAGMWVTGPSAYDPAVLRALGLDGGDRLVGFIALGTPAGAARVEPRRFDRHAFVSEWTGL